MNEARTPRMRVHIYHRIYPGAGSPLNSGTIRAVHGLASGLANSGARVTVLCHGRQSSQRLAADGFEIRCFADAPRRFKQLRVPRELREYIRNCEDPGVFVVNGPFSLNVSIVADLCARRGIPYVVAPHDPYHPATFKKRPHLKIPYWYLYERPMLRRAALIQVLDRSHAHWLAAYGVSTPTLEVPNGYLPEDIYPLQLLSWRVEGPPRLLYLGRCDAYNKGLDILLRALARLKDTTDALLTIQGPDGGDRKAMRILAENLGLQERVRFLDADFQQSSVSISAQYDVFVLPSRYEGFGLAAMEAMLTGRVVVVSSVAGIAPHVRASGAGVVAEPTVDAVEAAVMSVLKQRSEWQRMGLSGRNHVLENLRWERIAVSALEQYAQVAAKG
jgi:glycosyltransferase involved in cell wall biosynthesis